MAKITNNAKGSFYCQKLPRDQLEMSIRRRLTFKMMVELAVVFGITKQKNKNPISAVLFLKGLSHGQEGWTVILWTVWVD